MITNKLRLLNHGLTNLHTDMEQNNCEAKYVTAVAGFKNSVQDILDDNNK